MLVFNEKTGEFEEHLGPGETPSSPSIGPTSSTPSDDGYDYDNVRDTVYDILSDVLVLDIDEIYDDSDIVDDLGADSDDIQELIERVEEEFDIVILDEEWEAIDTVEELIDFICDELYLYDDEEDDEDEEEEEEDQVESTSTSDPIDWIANQLIERLKTGNFEELEKPYKHSSIDWSKVARGESPFK